MGDYDRLAYAVRRNGYIVLGSIRATREECEREYHRGLPLFMKEKDPAKRDYEIVEIEITVTGPVPAPPDGTPP